MIQYMKQLPTDVIIKIFSYYYSPQPKELMRDIRNYTKTFNEISYIYFTYWIENLPFPMIIDSKHDKQWLYKDLLKVYPKRECLKTQKLPLKMQIRIIWAILNPQQRTNFVTERRKIMIDKIYALPAF